MKWVAILSFVVVLSLTECRILQKRDHHEGHDDGHHEEHHDKPHTVGEAYKLLGPKTFDSVVMVEMSQNLQKCPFEEHVQRVKHVGEIGKKCSTDATGAECGKSVETVILDEMCRTPENTVKYPFHPECCAKADPDRQTCFESHKITDPDALPPYEKPPVEQICKEYQDDVVAFVRHYINRLSRKQPFLFAPAILSMSHHFELMTDECCKDPAHTAECFAEKKPPLIKELKVIDAMQQHSCYILKNFGERGLKAAKLSMTSQRMPRATFSNIQEIVGDLVHLIKHCCSGDMMECMADRLALSKKVCEKKSELSNKLAACCDKEAIEQSACIVKMENDDKPSDLSAEVREFIENPTVCTKYEAEKDGFLARFIYEYSRRHPELSTQMLLRLALGYEGFLKKCCVVEDKLACFSKAEDAMKEAVKTDVELLKTNCDALEKHGSYQYENHLLVKYAEKLPQVSTESLLELGDSMVHVGEKCCKLPESQQMPCSEGGLSLIIGKMCQKMGSHFVNDQVSHCCKDSYSAQRPCFTMMGPDKNYVPPAPSAELFHFDDKLCASADVKALEHIKQKFLVDLVKLKPGIEEDTLKTICARFLMMQEQCCKEGNPAACFGIEGPMLIKKTAELLDIPTAVKAI